jgi:hypothetical protein
MMRLIQQRVRPRVRTFLRATETVPGWFVSRNGADATSTPTVWITCPLVLLRERPPATGESTLARKAMTIYLHSAGQ